MLTDSAPSDTVGRQDTGSVGRVPTSLDELVRFLCEARAACGCESVEQCLQGQPNYGFRAERTGSTEVPECLMFHWNRIQEIGCDATPPRVCESCPMLQGTLEAGATCGELGSTCGDGLACSTPRGAADGEPTRCLEPCSQTNWVEEGGACVPPRTDTVSFCQVGLLCRDETCAPAPAVGQPCDGGACALGAVCRERACVAQGEDGTTCAAAADCVSTRCEDGVCQPFGEICGYSLL
ncbi:MAG: hypothetical protein ACI9KE_002588 [Polyangiales bacterium]|jgi:hypothetical protein